jgi:hypothetical protein
MDLNLTSRISSPVRKGIAERDEQQHRTGQECGVSSASRKESRQTFGRQLDLAATRRASPNWGRDILTYEVKSDYVRCYIYKQYSPSWNIVH